MKRGKGKGKAGKFAGRSLHVTVPAGPENPGTITDALANAERFAAAVLAPLGYVATADAKPGSQHWATALRLADQSPACRAAKRLWMVRDCRSAIARGDAESAAWSAYVLAEVIGRDKLDGLVEPVLRGIGNATHLAALAKKSKRRHVYDEAAAYAVQRWGRGMKPGKVWENLELSGRKHLNGRVLEVTDAGKRIQVTGYKSITRGVFLRTYLAPAREAAQSPP